MNDDEVPETMMLGIDDDPEAALSAVVQKIEVMNRVDRRLTPGTNPGKVGLFMRFVLTTHVGTKLTSKGMSFLVWYEGGDELLPVHYTTIDDQGRIIHILGKERYTKTLFKLVRTAMDSYIRR